MTAIRDSASPNISPERRKRRRLPPYGSYSTQFRPSLALMSVCVAIMIPTLVAVASDAPGASILQLGEPRGHWPTRIKLRGGGVEDEDADEKERFWSLGAIFRLNADVKDEASRAPNIDSGDDESKGTDGHDAVDAKLSMKPGNGRGGALAVRTASRPSLRRVHQSQISMGSLRQIDKEDNEAIGDDSIENIEDGESTDDAYYPDEEVNSSMDGHISGLEVVKNEEASWAQRTAAISEIASEVAEAEQQPSWIQEEAINVESNDRAAAPVETTTGTTAVMQSWEGTQAPAKSEQAFTMPGAESIFEIERVLDASPDAMPEGDTSLDSALPSQLQPPVLSKANTKTILPDRLKKMTRLWWGNLWTEPVPSSNDKELGASEGKHPTGESFVEPATESNEVHLSDKYGTSLDVSKVDATIETTSVEEDISTLEAFNPSDASPESGPDSMAQIDSTGFNRTRHRVSDVSGDTDKREAFPAAATLPKSLTEVQPRRTSVYISSGYWATIDKVASLGFSTAHPTFRISRHLRPVRKAFSRATGVHGILSGKGRRPIALLAHPEMSGVDTGALNDEDLDLIRRRITVIERAKKNVERKAAADAEVVVMNRRGIFRRNRRRKDLAKAALSGADVSEKQSTEDFLENQRRNDRVKQIDRLISKGQAELLELQCEKDALQRRPNPLYNYTTTSVETSMVGSDTTDTSVLHSREINFPPSELVEEYLDELFAHGRLTKLNHTHLWKNAADFDDDEEESIGDDLLTPSADARKLYEYKEVGRGRGEGVNNGNGNGGGGSWLLRQSIGKGGSFGEKIGEGVESAAYKAICTAVMEVLAKSIAAIHGVNVMTHSDIRLFTEDSPDLPPVGKSVLPGSDGDKNYAQEAILDVMTKSAKKRRRRGSQSRRGQFDESFIQRDAVVETLISHCQISAPLLKLFPLAWQRALLGNIITLIGAVVSDFCDGIQLQILGHQLSFSFKPITESDMIRHIGMAGHGFNNRRARPEQFEAAVRATADDVSENLKFLDRWHERALGSGKLRAQIANLIARIVLTLADEVLSGARMDLWAAQAGGPRMVAGLEYRTSSSPGTVL